MDIEKEQTALFDKLGVFFAFSDKQFNEQKQNNIKYTSLGAGIICPTNNIKDFVRDHKEIVKNGRDRHKRENSPEKIIEDALSNYECYYTHDIEDAVDDLRGYGFTEEKIWAVFHATKHNHGEG